MAPLMLGYDLNRTGRQLFLRVEMVEMDGWRVEGGGWCAWGLNDASGGDLSFLASAGADS
jgi:hypothetical protein